MFLDGIAEKLEEGAGFRSPFLEIINLNCLLYADDIALMARSQTDLNKLLEICVQYAKRNNFLFSPKKCVFMSNASHKFPS
jgi:hypothetical protein